jgi:uncharacterized protein YjbI with pentapeptide repeats
MATGTAVPWDTCVEQECLGARSGTGEACLVHLADDDLAATLAPSRSGSGVDLDGRGVHFTRTDVERILAAVPVDEAGRQLFETVRLDRATFEHGASFDNASFAGEVSVTDAEWKGEARFGAATFAGPVDFRGTTFGGQAWFVGATFARPASFRYVRFIGPAWFQHAAFDADASFDGASFSANANLTEATFAGEASFCGTSFGGHARFERTNCAGWWRFDGARFALEDEGPERPVVPPPAEPVAPIPGTPPARSRRAPAGAERWSRLAPVNLPLVGVILVVVALVFIVMRPVGSPPEKPGLEDRRGPDRFAFLHKDEAGAPTRYNPCEPLHFVVNADGGPPGWTTQLQEAILELSAASGLTFEYDGPTTERVEPDLPGEMNRIYDWPKDVPGYTKAYRKLFNRPSFQPDRYARDRWAPILIAWSPFGRLNLPYGHKILGVAASEPRTSDGRASYVSGTLILNADAPQGDMRATIMHELGHVVGLAHVPRDSELMNPELQGQTTWGEGDREGLSALGKDAGCFEPPVPGR